MERTTNWMILGVFSMQLLMCLAAALANTAYNHQFKDSWYLQFDASFSTAAINGILSFITFIILLNNLIPISLYITMEIVKFGQAYFINNDLNMYYEPKDTPAQVGRLERGKKKDQPFPYQSRTHRPAPRTSTRSWVK